MALASWLDLTVSCWIWKADRMTNPYYGYRFPAEIISYCVWLYYTFPLSFREIEKMMFHRGITVTCEVIRGWRLKFAQGYANKIRKQRPKPGDKRHLNEVVIRIKGEQYISGEPSINMAWCSMLENRELLCGLQVGSQSERGHYHRHSPAYSDLPFVKRMIQIVGIGAIVEAFVFQLLQGRFTRSLEKVG